MRVTGKALRSFGGSVLGAGLGVGIGVLFTFVLWPALENPATASSFFQVAASVNSAALGASWLLIGACGAIVSGLVAYRVGATSMAAVGGGLLSLGVALGHCWWLGLVLGTGLASSGQSASAVGVVWTAVAIGWASFVAGLAVLIRARKAASTAIDSREPASLDPTNT